MNVGDWTLWEFFIEMFTYCFPVDFQTKQREKLRRAYQRDKTVTEYCHELEELYNMIGSIPEREKVVKLWNGLRTSIQRSLWRDGLNPELSSWLEVRKVAEIIEIAENVLDPYEGRASRRNNHRRHWNLKNSEGQDHRSREHDDWHWSHQEDRQKQALESSKFLNKNKAYVKQAHASAGPKRTEEKNTPKLSSKERDELRAQGKCFRCHETGHVSRHCPSGNTMKGGRNGRAPGLVANAVGFGFDSIEKLREAAETADTMDSVMLAALCWEVEPLMKRHPCVGDLAAQRVVQLLESMAPYPHNGPSVLATGEQRFHAYSTGNGLHEIIDYEHATSGTEAISTDLLYDEDFCVSEWYADRRAFRNGEILESNSRWSTGPPMGDVLLLGLLAAVQEGADKYPPRLDGTQETDWEIERNSSHFSILEKSKGTCINIPTTSILDPVFDIISHYHNKLVQLRIIKSAKHDLPCWDGCLPRFDLQGWYADCIYKEDASVYKEEHGTPSDDDSDKNGPHRVASDEVSEVDLLPLPWSDPESILNWSDIDDYVLDNFDGLTISGVQVQRRTMTGLQHNAAALRDFMQIVPKHVVVVIKINGHPARALLDSGSVGDFMSTSLADQLKVQKITLEKLLPLQLAVQGSRSKVNYGVKVNL
ncbi:hypothetical protein H0H87_007467, partial [Tephrocybe sp. NHM501043]